jgi:excisionase family DNA binding protein
MRHKNKVLVFDSDEELIDKITSNLKSAFKEELSHVNNKPRKNSPQYLTRQEAADKLRISLSTLHRLVLNHYLPCKKVGRRAIFLESDVEAVLLDKYI